MFTMLKILTGTSGYSLVFVVTSLLLFCTSCATSANREHVLFPAYSDLKNRNTSRPNISDTDSVLSTELPNITPTHDTAIIASLFPTKPPENNKIDDKNKNETGWRFPGFKDDDVLRRRHEEEERRKKIREKTKTETEFGVSTEETKTKSKGRWIWPTIIVVIVVCVIAVIVADSRTCVYFWSDCSSPSNTAEAIQTPNAPEHTLMNGTVPHNHEEERRFFSTQRSLDVPPPYPGVEEELPSPTSPPPDYSSGLVQLGDRNAQFSKT